MKTADLISINDFCLYHNVEYAFIESLYEADLVKVTLINETTYIPGEELRKLEKLINLYQLDINVAGIEAISHLLHRMEKMQNDMQSLKNKLRLYESE
ncbi:MerR family transcriptional regulator [Mucilaginibacter sp. HC2]|uniref:chaperone modulator CbpM n=1 Tax=Mucilaginibacter inviolabilis TaxID=2714892 RepID=UPI001409CE04|nr:chaperone modulator CbpM [Mucilaginibacter inviolabilis]NHA03009.1 MerR family transcriptional regulator [Mucilaginibacter inviolabilis]